MKWFSKLFLLMLFCFSLGAELAPKAEASVCLLYQGGTCIVWGLKPPTKPRKKPAPKKPPVVVNPSK